MSPSTRKQISQVCMYLRKLVRFQYLKQYCGMEQLVARRAHNPKVVGSSPASATIKEQNYVSLIE